MGEGVVGIAPRWSRALHAWRHDRSTWLSVEFDVERNGGGLFVIFNWKPVGIAPQMAAHAGPHGFAQGPEADSWVIFHIHPGKWVYHGSHSRRRNIAKLLNPVLKPTMFPPSRLFGVFRWKYRNTSSMISQSGTLEKCFRLHSEIDRSHTIILVVRGGRESSEPETRGLYRNGNS